MKKSLQPLFGQQMSGLHFQHIGGLPQVAQVNIVVAEVHKILIFSPPYFDGGWFAAPSFSHLSDELIVGEIDLSCQLLNDAFHGVSHALRFHSRLHYDAWPRRNTGQMSFMKDLNLNIETDLETLYPD
ncbi:MAG: hypothetical protein M5U11_14195 [Anaerolineales bacterium]|jgi:hypothetical protein|nr:hypothetical protein [Anaerolineales bacterium]MCZ7550280.1 hypothetical protein [Anaerolineales bacterium]MDX9935879.1 hypothetical protein [Anaerolineales bacterium]NOG75662.1 hypothetical protein [Chloroflexota bacterium]WKZ53085.1 MAG: hypothetical protein QY324_09650 [Anaerolineales bacterium]